MSLAKDKEESVVVLIFLKQPRINVVLIEMNGKLIVLLYAVALSEFYSRMTEGIKSSCKSVAVNKGEGTNITCHFDEDIRRIQKDVKLYHEKDTVFTIAWNDGFPDIHTKSGYQFDGRITTNITVKISRAETEHAGKYTCQVVLSKAFEATPCTLVISNPCAVNLNITERDQITTACKHESNEDEFFDKIDKAAIIVLSLSLAMSVCANVYFLYKTKCFSVFSKKQKRKYGLAIGESEDLPANENCKALKDLPEKLTDLSKQVVQTDNTDDNQSDNEPLSSDNKHNRNDSACYSIDDL